MNHAEFTQALLIALLILAAIPFPLLFWLMSGNSETRAADQDEQRIAMDVTDY